MSSLWWWALPVLLLPILWHRQKRERIESVPLATARFLPSSMPVQRRVWRWQDLLLLLLRCLLLASLIALLADPVLSWRGDSVLVVPGTDPGVVERAVAAARLQEPRRIALPDRDAYGWLHAHEREFDKRARLLVVGDVAMPATLPRLRHALSVHPQAVAPRSSEHHVAVFSGRMDAWRALFGAVDGPARYLVEAQAGAKTELVVWDRPEAPPAGLRAPLWWVADTAAFPELAKAAAVDGMRVLDSPRGRLWSATWLPPRDADAARTLLASWRRLHAGIEPFTAPPQAPLADARAPAGPEGGALRDALGIALLVLFALERILSHVRRR